MSKTSFVSFLSDTYRKKLKLFKLEKSFIGILNHQLLKGKTQYLNTTPHKSTFLSAIDTNQFLHSSDLLDKICIRWRTGVGYGNTFDRDGNGTRDRNNNSILLWEILVRVKTIFCVGTVKWSNAIAEVITHIYYLYMCVLSKSVHNGRHGFPDTSKG